MANSIKKLEFLSGFNMGSVLNSLLEANVNGSELTKRIIEYSDQWGRLHRDEHFISGLKIGIKMEDLPELKADMREWFKSLN